MNRRSFLTRLRQRIWKWRVRRAWRIMTENAERQNAEMRAATNEVFLALEESTK